MVYGYFVILRDFGLFKMLDSEGVYLEESVFEMGLVNDFLFLCYKFVKVVVYIYMWLYDFSVC